MVNYKKFQIVKKEIIDLVNSVLDQVKEHDFSNYVLLLAGADYYVGNEKTSSSPYIIASNIGRIVDTSRMHFMLCYLNDYYVILQQQTQLEMDKEYEIYMQLMVYSHIWESYPFLKTLVRISALLKGDEYKWHIPFEYKDKKGELRPISKSTIINKDILDCLKLNHPPLYSYINDNYKSEIRNNFAHSTFFIDLQDGWINSVFDPIKIITPLVSFEQWDEIFIKSLLFCFYLEKLIENRRNNFMEDYSEMKSVHIKWPSFNNPGTYYDKELLPKKTEVDNNIYCDFYWKK